MLIICSVFKLHIFHNCLKKQRSSVFLEYTVWFFFYVCIPRHFCVLCLVRNRCFVCVCVCLLTFWLLARFLFLWMVAVSLWFSHATGQHAARARNRKKGKKKGGGLERRGEGRGWVFMAVWRRTIILLIRCGCVCSSTANPDICPHW